jgi:hypothetical protein
MAIVFTEPYLFGSMQNKKSGRTGRVRTIHINF